MTSLDPSECCTLAVTHDGHAKGKIIKIEDFEAYIVYPKDISSTKAIILFSDIFGHRFINSQLIADELAANGYIIVVPDLFHGDPAPLNHPGGFNVAEWIKGPPGHLADRVDPVVEATVKHIRNNLGCKKIGGVGYCFGAKYVIRWLNHSQNHIDAGYVAHPSLVEPKELAAIGGPLSIAAAETDHVFPAPKRHESEEILIKTKMAYQINLYGGVSHGFAIRADISKPDIRFAQTQAFQQAVQWFQQHL